VGLWFAADFSYSAAAEAFHGIRPGALRLGLQSRPTRNDESLVMTQDIAERLRPVLAAIDDHIDVLRGLGLDDTAQLLAIARLDLQMRLHGISHEELDALCEALESANRNSRIAEVIDLASRAARKA
jgi:hypothetical protein